VRAGSINPNLFQDQEYKYGSLVIRIPPCVRVPLGTRKNSIEMQSDCIAATFRCVAMAPTPAPQISASANGVRGIAKAPTPSFQNQRLLIEYKPFEPAFYHTNIADWGMALHLAGNPAQAKSLSTPAIITPLRTLNNRSPGSFRRRCSGIPFMTGATPTMNLTLGSIDPIRFSNLPGNPFLPMGTGKKADIAYMN